MSAKENYRGFRTDKGRLKEEPAEHLDFHRSSLLGESIHGIHAFDKAHALMLGEVGVNDEETTKTILLAFRKMENEGMETVRAQADGGMHSGEHYLIQNHGTEIGGRLHLGRSSGDLIEVARRLTFRNHLLQLLGDLSDLRGVLTELASSHLTTVMPGYTHGQHAQPTTLAHWAMMFEAVFARDTQRGQSFYKRLNLSPAGAAIMTGSDFPLDRKRVSDLLGFASPISNTMDAILSHDLEIEYAGLLSLISQNIARIAEDLFMWSTAEFAMVEIPDRYCGTSSIMPQKKNPDGLEDIKGLASQGISLVTMVSCAEKGPTGFPIMERRHTQETLWSFCTSLGVRVRSLADILGNLGVKTELMRHRAGSNWAQITDLAGALVQHAKMDWRTAHQVVALLVRNSIEAGRAPKGLTKSDLECAATEHGVSVAGLSDTAFKASLDPLTFVERRGLIGGPAPTAVQTAIDAAKESQERDRADLMDLANGAAAANKLLENAIDAFLEKGAAP